MMRAVILFAGLTIAGCSQQSGILETPPVTVNTTLGPVVCQLYSPSTTLWDRAISRPPAVPQGTADRICQQEGGRRLVARETGVLPDIPTPPSSVFQVETAQPLQPPIVGANRVVAIR